MEESNEKMTTVVLFSKQYRKKKLQAKQGLLGWLGFRLITQITCLLKNPFIGNDIFFKKC